MTLATVRQSIDSMDFRYIWVAGETWASGGNPYSTDYAAVGERAFPIGYPVLHWMYPFHWYVPSTMMALFVPEYAFGIWITGTTIGLIASAWLICSVSKRSGARFTIEGVLLGIAFVSVATPITSVIRMGAPVALAEIGIATLVFGVFAGRNVVSAIGVMLALLKPQLGLPIIVGMALLPGAWRIVAAGSLLTVLASVPAFLAGGFMPQVEGLAGRSFSSY